MSAYLFFRAPRVLEHSAHMLLALSFAKPAFVLSSLFLTVQARLGSHTRFARILRHAEKKATLAIKRHKFCKHLPRIANSRNL